MRLRSALGTLDCTPIFLSLEGIIQDVRKDARNALGGDIDETENFRFLGGRSFIDDRCNLALDSFCHEGGRVDVFNSAITFDISCVLCACATFRSTITLDVFRVLERRTLNLPEQPSTGAPLTVGSASFEIGIDRKSTRLNSSH